MRGFYRRSGHGRTTAAAFAVLLVAAGSGFGRACAEETPAAAPERIVVFGDSQAQGIAGGLERILLHDPHYKIINRTHPGASLVHSSNEWLEPIQRFTAHETADVAIVMFGANDRIDMREGPGGRYLHFRTDAWKNAYVSRADEILAALKNAHLKVIWCGNPIARSPTYSADMSYINGLLDQEATKYGDKFFPLWTVIVDAKGHYTAYGPDRNGVNERLRGDDGIHFTSAGYEVVAEKLMDVVRTMQPAVAKASPAPGANPATPANAGPTNPASSAAAPDGSVAAAKTQSQANDANTTAKDPKPAAAKAPGG